MMLPLRFRKRVFSLPENRVWIMGVLNAAPDSFSDGSVPVENRVETLLSAKPDMIDIGGESTRPGASEVPVPEEIRRILPVLKRVRCADPEILISIDTRKSEVARAALDSGADIINDISNLAFDPEIAEVAAKDSAGLILNHARGTPESMNRAEYLQYPDGVAEEVSRELQKSVDKALAAGVEKESIILDPGLGFSKTTAQCLELIANPGALLRSGFPLLAGPSRKRFIGELSGETSAADRDFGTCGAAIAAVLSGYRILRVHNVRAIRDCLSVFLAAKEKHDFFPEQDLKNPKNDV